MVAETTTSGGERKAGSDGFRILAGYIFGKNSAAERMAMTTPVTTRSSRQTMKMTAPVTVGKAAKNEFTMRFVMERKYTLESLPKPDDARVSIVAVLSRTVAVLRYSGPPSEMRFQQQREILLASAWIGRIGSRQDWHADGVHFASLRSSKCSRTMSVFAYRLYIR